MSRLLSPLCDAYGRLLLPMGCPCSHLRVKTYHARAFRDCQDITPLSWHLTFLTFRNGATSPLKQSVGVSVAERQPQVLYSMGVSER
jgi:hypothetical protein